MLSSNQSGFRRFHSTTTSLVNVTDRWLSNIDKRLVTGALFIELRKAFDTVDLQILLMKVQHYYGLSGTELKWFSSYVSDRLQSVSINGTLSGRLPLSVGVPQGSVLGPLLFILYDLPNL